MNRGPARSGGGQSKGMNQCTVPSPKRRPGANFRWASESSRTRTLPDLAGMRATSQVREDVGTVGAKLFASHQPACGSLDVDTKPFAEALSGAKRLSQIAHRRATSAGEVHLVKAAQGIQVEAKTFHEQSLPMGISASQYPQAIYLVVTHRNNRAMEINEHWRLRLIELKDDLGLKQAELALKLEKSPDYVSRLLYAPGKKGRKNLGLQTIRTAVQNFDLAAGWFDLPLGTDLPSARTDRGMPERHAPVTAAHRTPMRNTLGALGDALSAATPQTREAVAAMLASFAKDPDSGGAIADAVASLLEQPTKLDRRKSKAA